MLYLAQTQAPAPAPPAPIKEDPTLGLYVKYGMWAFVLLVIGVLLIKNRAAVGRFLEDVWEELKKCSWPWDPAQTGLKKYRELIDSTVTVVITTLFLAAYVTSMDFVLLKVVGGLIRMHTGT